MERIRKVRTFLERCNIQLNGQDPSLSTYPFSLG